MLSGISDEAYRYQLGARWAIERIIDRYQVEDRRRLGHCQRANDWLEDPRCIIELLVRIVAVSSETTKIVDGLLALDIIGQRPGKPTVVPCASASASSRSVGSLLVPGIGLAAVGGVAESLVQGARPRVDVLDA